MRETLVAIEEVTVSQSAWKTRLLDLHHLEHARVNELLVHISIGLQLQNNLKLTSFKPFAVMSKLFYLLKRMKLAENRCFRASNRPSDQ